MILSEPMPVEMQITCTNCHAILAWAEKLHDEGLDRWGFEFVGACPHVTEKDVRHWWLTPRVDRVRLDLPVTTHRARSRRV
jgi:hypothetical protein